LHALIGYFNSAIHLPALFWVSPVTFSSYFSEKKELFGAGYPLVWTEPFFSVSEENFQKFMTERYWKLEFVEWNRTNQSDWSN